MISTVPNKPAPTYDSAMFAELDKHRRHRGLHLLTWLFWLLVLAAIVAAVAAVAATGAISVPVISPMVYPSDPQPTRTVTASPFDIASLASQAKPSGSSVSIPLTEANLSSLVAADHLGEFRQAQLMVDSDKITFFGYAIHTPTGKPLAFTFSFVPQVAANGSLSCSATGFTVGYLPLPANMFSGITSLVCQQFVGTITPKGATLTSIMLSAGTATVTETVATK